MNARCCEFADAYIYTAHPLMILLNSDGERDGHGVVIAFCPFCGRRLTAKDGAVAPADVAEVRFNLTENEVRASFAAGKLNDEIARAAVRALWRALRAEPERADGVSIEGVITAVRR